MMKLFIDSNNIVVLEYNQNDKVTSNLNLKEYTVTDQKIIDESIIPQNYTYDYKVATIENDAIVKVEIIGLKKIDYSEELKNQIATLYMELSEMEGDFG